MSASVKFTGRLLGLCIENRVCQGLASLQRRQLSCAVARCFMVSPLLCAEPLKKKKKVDPMVIRGREERRRKKLEKAIRVLHKSSQQLKPLVENDVPRSLRLEISDRTRVCDPVAPEDALKQLMLSKEWAVYKRQQIIQDVKEIRGIFRAQQKALKELQLESEQLYQDAIQEDEALLSYELCGPVLTLPPPGYDSPDGDYFDTTKRWD